MSDQTTLTIAAKDEDEFDGLLTRADALAGLVWKFERRYGSQTMAYQTAAVRRFEANPDTLVVVLDFDSTVLKILGLDLNGRDALMAVEAATKH